MGRRMTDRIFFLVLVGCGLVNVALAICAYGHWFGMSLHGQG